LVVNYDCGFDPLCPSDISPKYDMKIRNDYSKSSCRIWGRGCSLPKLDGLYAESAYKIRIVAFGEGWGWVELRAIVGRLEALSAETGRLEEIYEAKVESLEELKRSVLGKAFEGEL
jgi:hypothetical protein